MFAKGARVTVIGSPSGNYDGKSGKVISGEQIVEVEFFDGSRERFWHEDLKSEQEAIISEAAEQLAGLLVTYVGTADMDGRELGREIIRRGQYKWEKECAPKDSAR